MSSQYRTLLLRYVLDLSRLRDRHLQMKSQAFKSVWDAIADTPEEAALLKLRSALMMKAKSIIDEQSLTRAQASKLFGVTRPRMSDLMRGKIDLFSLEILVTMLARAGQTVELKVSRVRRSRVAA
jgi:predicted XRE-type DNA-binding protein